MRIRPRLLMILPLLVCGPALADEEKYTFHEALKPGDVVVAEIAIEDHENVTTTQEGKSEVDSSVTRHAWKLEETILAVKAGSSTRTRIKVAAGSVDAARASADADETVTPCPYVREDVIVERHLDDAITDDFTGEAGPDDTNDLHDVLNPDQNWFPDKPVAVGDSWDISAKIAKQYNLEKGDTTKFDCRLDWVKTIDGRRTAQVSSTGRILQHSGGRVELSTEQQTTMLIGVADGLILQFDQTSKVKYSTPADEPVRMTRTSQTTYHSTAKNKPPEDGAPVGKP